MISLKVHDALEKELARQPSQEENERELARTDLSYVRRNLLTIRERCRANLAEAMRRFRKGTLRLLKQVHITQ